MASSSSNKPGDTDPKAAETQPAEPKATPAPAAPAPAAPAAPEPRIQETATEAKRAGYDVEDIRKFRDDPSQANHDKAVALLRKTGPLAVDGDVYTLDGAGRVQGGPPDRRAALRPVEDAERIGFGGKRSPGSGDPNHPA
jgi:hypothetical protein